jgi:hypothetical protein
VICAPCSARCAFRSDGCACAQKRYWPWAVCSNLNKDGPASHRRRARN